MNEQSKQVYSNTWAGMQPCTASGASSEQGHGHSNGLLVFSPKSLQA